MRRMYNQFIDNSELFYILYVLYNLINISFGQNQQKLLHCKNKSLMHNLY